MTRTAPAARVARARHFSDGVQSPIGNLAFDSAFRNKETRADECFIAGPVVTRRIAVLANGSQQGIARQFRTMLSAGLQLWELTFYQCARILADNGRLTSRHIQNSLGQ